MSGIFGHSPEQEAIGSVDANITQVLKIVMSLSHRQLSSQSLAGLKAIRDTADRLISEANQLASMAPDVEHTQTAERIQKAFNDPAHASGTTDEPANEPHYWRSRRKTQSERDEKKARLAKREELIRQLRCRVNESKKSEPNDEFEGTGSQQQQDAELQKGNQRTIPTERYSVRLQRASFWPQGSVEWARQLLGVELGMTESEKRQCYLEMVKMCHPDQNTQVPADAMQWVNLAWERLR